MITLDKSQPYGAVSGIIQDKPGAKYFQKGEYFDTAGRWIGKETTAAVEPTVKPKAANPVARHAIVYRSSLSDIKLVAKQLGIKYTTKADTVRAIQQHVKINLP